MKRDQKQERSRAEFLSKCWVTWYEIGFGVRQYTCFTPGYVCPIGLVWVLSIGGKADTAHVLHSYVHPFYRRRGVRTLMNKTIFQHHRLIQTWEGSKEGGAAFLKASGYRYDRVRRDWHLLREGMSKRTKR